MKSFVFIILIAALITQLGAQDAEILHLHFTHAPVETQEGNQSLQNLDFQLRYPLIIKGKHIFLTGINYEQSRLNTIIQDAPQSIHSVAIPLAWQYKMNNRASLSFLFTPGIYSDFQDISRKDIRFSGGIRYKWEVNETLGLGVGIGYARQFFGNMLAPFIELDWQLNKKLRLHGPFPLKPQLTYQLSDKWSLATQLNVNNNSSRLSESAYNNQFVQVKQWDLGLKTEWKFYKAFYLHSQISYAFRRKVELYDASTNVPWTVFTFPIDGEKNPIQQVDKPGMMLELGFTMKIQ